MIAESSDVDAFIYKCVTRTVRYTAAELSEVLIKQLWNQKSSVVLFQQERAAHHMAFFLQSVFTIRDDTMQSGQHAHIGPSNSNHRLLLISGLIWVFALHACHKTCSF